MLNKHKNWLVHKQTACGKDFSNPFMVDNLPKIVGFSTYLASLVKSWLVQDQTVLALTSPKANELTIPEQTATGKGTSNPFMAGWFCTKIQSNLVGLLLKRCCSVAEKTKFIDVIDEILEEDFDALLDEGSKILHSIEGTLLEEEIFAEFKEFMAMTADENSDSESDIEDPPFEKITINTDYKIKTSLEDPPMDLVLNLF
ncbi:hypothetical protein Tco_1193601 [Tanacetum coccineum]